MTRPRVLGVVGTLVWDRIIGTDGASGAVEEWGGIAYALSALSASLPERWTIRPILKIGGDLEAEGRQFLREIPRIDDSGVIAVPEANNRVELRYESESRRVENLTGGVLPWEWDELSPLVGGCDALYVNFVSGHEMGLESATALRSGFAGPMYADLHSLFLGTDGSGRRHDRSLESWASWFRCFDAVQMNADELALLGGGPGDPWARAEGALGEELGLILVTRGDHGAGFVAREGLDPNPMSWRSGRDRNRVGRTLSGSVTLTAPPIVGDPTGCGDVWGATMFARLLHGDDIEAAMRAANELAGLNVQHRGARGLVERFAGSVAQHPKNS